MKKVLIILWALLALSLCSCGGNEPNVPISSEVPNASVSSKNMVVSDSKKQTEAEIIVVYEQQITLELAFGSKTGLYSGEMVNGLPNGKGKFTTQNGEGVTWCYEGGFVVGHFDGEGTTIWEDGSRKEEGIFKSDLLNGYGKLYTDGQLIYEGEFIDGDYDEQAFEQQFKQLCQEVDYKSIERLPDSYEGKLIKIIGKVIQVSEGEDGNVDYRVATKDGYDEIFYTFYQRVEDEVRILENDIITAWGFCGGVISYSSVGAGKVTIPAMAAWYIEIE